MQTSSDDIDSLETPTKDFANFKMFCLYWIFNAFRILVLFTIIVAAVIFLWFVFSQSVLLGIGVLYAIGLALGIIEGNNCLIVLAILIVAQLVVLGW